MKPKQKDKFNIDQQTPSRRQVLKYAGASALSLGVLSSPASATPDADCTLNGCTREFLLAAPFTPQLESGHWDGETIEFNKTTIKVGAQVPGVPKSQIGAPFAFDPIVTCVQAGTTVDWKWVNQNSISTDIPVTVPHNVDIFQYTSGCGYVADSFVTSGHPEGFNPPEDKDPVKFQHTFDEPGVYPYYCEPHGYPALAGLPDAATPDPENHDEPLPPNLIGMRGAVIVTEKRGNGR